MKAWFLINGILTFPGSSKNWTGRGVTWLNTRTEAKAEKIEYLCGPIGRALGQMDRAYKLWHTLSYYDGDDNYVVGHSNGADVIISMLRDFPLCPKIRELHLVCGASESDFNRNGLNRLLGTGKIGRVIVYVAKKDEALRLAHTWLGHILGYGTLGLDGPTSVLPSVESSVKTIEWPDYGHSDCWHDDNFEATMRQITATPSMPSPPL